jgi:predicted permease
MFDRFLLDLKFTVRTLRGARSFSIVVILVLALGIAATTIVFALVNGVVLQPLPVHAQRDLIVAWKQLPAAGFDHYPFGDSEIETIGRESRLFNGVAGVTSNGVGRMVLLDGSQPGYARVALVTQPFFQVLGASPIAGRVFASAEGSSGSEKTVVLSHGYWLRRYGGDRAVVGRRVRLDGDVFTVIGVMPRGFDYPRGADLWRTTRSVRTDGPFGDAARREVDLIARLRPGVSLEQATAELNTLNQQLERDAAPGELRGLVPVIRSLDDVVLGDVRFQLWTLFGAVSLVLVVACANVAGVELMRCQARSAEFSVRAALGADRWRIGRELAMESSVLTIAGAALGLSIAAWTLPALAAAIPEGLPKLESVTIDLWVVLFVAALSFLITVLSGVLPVLLSLRSDVALHLRRAAPGSALRSPGFAQRALVVAQVALAIVTVACAILLARSVLRLQEVDTGMSGDGLVFVELGLPALTNTHRARHEHLLDELIARFESSSGIAAVTPVNIEPFSGSGWGVPTFTAEGQNAISARENPALNLESIYPNHFQTFRIPLVRGRPFTDADRDGAPPVAIVSADLAQRIWGEHGAIGRRLKMGNPGSTGPWYTIVGVAAATRYRELTRHGPTLYLPAPQFQMTATILAIRTGGTIDGVMSLAREIVTGVDPDVQVVRSISFEQLLNVPLVRPRFNAYLMTFFGFAALLLGAVGLHVVMLYSVAQRVREVAIRIALGAAPGTVGWEILADAAQMIGLGTFIGLGCAVAAARMLRGLLSGVGPLDPIVFVGSVALLVLAGGIATAWPAWTAARTDPAIALRAE